MKKVAQINHSTRNCRLNLYLDGLQIVTKKGEVVHTMLSADSLYDDLRALYGMGGKPWELTINE